MAITSAQRLTAGVEGRITAEIAGVSNDITFPALAGAFRQLDPVILSRGGSQGIHIYDDLFRDPKSRGALMKRLLAVTAKKWEVIPASDKLKDKKAAEGVAKQLNNIPFNRIRYNLLKAIVYGFTVGEVMWELRDGQYVVTDVLDRDQVRFLMGPEYQVQLKVPGDMFPGQVISVPRKFIWHTVGSVANNPYGRGVGEAVWFWTFFKQEATKLWFVFAEKYAGPTVIAQHTEDGVSQELQQAAKQLAENVATGLGVSVPKGLELKLLESNRTTAVEVYLSLINLCDEQIALGILGESVTTGHGERSSRAAVAEYGDMFLAQVTSDSNMICDTLNGTIVKWICELNYPGATPPKLVCEIAPETDLFKKAQTYQYMGSLGYRPTLETVAEEFGGEWEEYAGNIGAKPGQAVNDTTVQGSQQDAETTEQAGE
ncbi:phage portal protein family protein [Burkholderia ubonensis]|uniref:phage portal protein family protein n=1 Tax=Burkholderia ubonensis TaxID=101571 RepID=UPI0007547930|nr:DUF935 family protein [Burkholderia ubonensis]KVD70130.1 hypothetical protein WI88_30815 [Burkholderia ubonensis]